MKKMEILKSVLQNTIDNIDAGNSNASDEVLDGIIDVINKATNVETRLSKYQACKYLNVSRATFDNYVRDGKLPKGKKQQGFKELSWDLGTLQTFKNKQNDSNIKPDNSDPDWTSRYWEI